LEIIGDEVTLLNFSNYSGGLDTKANLHGTHSYYKFFQSNEVFFHVSPMIPQPTGHDPARKRHIGNDIAVIIFIDDMCSEDDAVDIATFKSQFNHIWIAVKKLKAEHVVNFAVELGPGASEKTWYQVEVATAAGVRSFFPRTPSPPYIEKSKLREWLLTKCINGERRTIDETRMFSDKIAYTRKRLLEDVLKNLDKSSGTKKLTLPSNLN